MDPLSPDILGSNVPSYDRDDLQTPPPPVRRILVDEAPTIVAPPPANGQAPQVATDAWAPRPCAGPSPLRARRSNGCGSKT